MNLKRVTLEVFKNIILFVALFFVIGSLSGKFLFSYDSREVMFFSVSATILITFLYNKIAKKLNI